MSTGDVSGVMGRLMDDCWQRMVTLCGFVSEGVHNWDEGTEVGLKGGRACMDAALVATYTLACVTGRRGRVQLGDDASAAGLDELSGRFDVHDLRVGEGCKAREGGEENSTRGEGGVR